MIDILCSAAWQLEKTLSLRDQACGELFRHVHKQILDTANWAAILRWVLDQLYLVNVPPYCAITQASQVLWATLQCFHSDTYWVDALVSGRLSLTNHLDKDDDLHKRAITQALNW